MTPGESWWLRLADVAQRAGYWCARHEPWTAGMARWQYRGTRLFGGLSSRLYMRGTGLRHPAPWYRAEGP